MARNQAPPGRPRRPAPGGIAGQGGEAWILGTIEPEAAQEILEAGRVARTPADRAGMKVQQESSKRGVGQSGKR